jgi:hypothetical protein
VRGESNGWRMTRQAKCVPAAIWSLPVAPRQQALDWSGGAVERELTTSTSHHRRPRRCHAGAPHTSVNTRNVFGLRFETCALRLAL